jgi:tetratricopeptide (TPR) repeat protein
MERIRTKLVATGLLAAAAWMSAAVADDAMQDAERAEQARQEAFRGGMQAIAADLGRTNYDSFMAAIDRNDLVERIFGLRLIDPHVKKQFTDNLDYTFEPLIKSAFTETEDGLRATLLGVESSGTEGRAVLRFDLPDFQFDYHEYLLRLNDQGRLVVVDWTDFLEGMLFSESVGRELVMALPSNAAERKLLDFQNVSDTELFQFGELLKAARDRKLDRYLQIRDSMDERFRQQRIVVETTVQLAKTVRRRRDMVGGLQVMAELYPDEPMYSLMLLDYYFPARKYAEALAALTRLYARLGFEDAAMEARLSAAELVLGKTDEARTRADRAVSLEPGLELGWWSALGVRVALGDYAGSVEALKVLEDKFRYDLGPDALERNPAYRGLLASDEYRSWRNSHK